MSRRVLVPVDNSEPSEKALDDVFELFDDVEIHVVHVLDPSEMYTYADPGIDGGAPVNIQEIEDSRETRAERLFEGARETAADHGIEIETELLRGRPARAIVEYAEEQDVDHVVMGSHGRSGVSRILLGSVAETVTRRAPMPVTIVR